MQKEKIKSFRQRITLGLVFFILLLTIVIVGIRAVSAETIASVTGSAQILNTSNFLYFSGYSTNVTVNNNTHQFSGYAWSEDLGWIAFGTTDNSDGPVVFDPSSGAVTGKARIINTDTVLDFNSSPYSSNVIISPDGSFSGYAWGEDLGWLNFSEVSAPGIDFGSNPINILPETGAVGQSILLIIIFMALLLILLTINFNYPKRRPQ